MRGCAPIPPGLRRAGIRKPRIAACVPAMTPSAEIRHSLPNDNITQRGVEAGEEEYWNGWGRGARSDSGRHAPDTLWKPGSTSFLQLHPDGFQGFAALQVLHLMRRADGQKDDLPVIFVAPIHRRHTW